MTAHSRVAPPESNSLLEDCSGLMYFTDLHCTSYLDGMFVNTNVQTLLNAFTLCGGLSTWAC